MSMPTALSGLMAAQKEISATSNNIANVGTVGFRSSRVEFSDVFSSSPFNTQRTAVGSGVQVQRITQNFAQGNVVTTGNMLDLAVEGQGFFALQPPADANGTAGETQYTRNGAFSLDETGNVVNAQNKALLCWPVGTDGTALTNKVAQAVPLQVPLQAGVATATSLINLKAKLPSDNAMIGSQAAVPPTATFDPTDATTYAKRTAVPVMDADGKAVEGEAYFVKIASPSGASTDTIYEMHLMVDGDEVAPTTAGTTNRVTFDGTGNISAGEEMTFAGFTVDLGGSTLSSGAFEVETVSHNGASVAKLTNLELDGSGSVWVTYGSGERVAMGQVLLATFPNPQGLKQQGGATFTATADSGSAVAGTAATAGYGAIRAGALERSNVELTEELVNLISAQRNYQANAKAMETSTSLMQTIMNIRN